MKKVPPFLYEPEKRSLRAVGQVLDKLPVPGLGIGGPMHRVPSLQWKTWVRLAFVEAGKDWRSLNRLTVEDGKLRDYLIIPGGSWEGAGQLGVNEWDKPVRWLELHDPATAISRLLIQDGHRARSGTTEMHLE